MTLTSFVLYSSQGAVSFDTSWRTTNQAILMIWSTLNNNNRNGHYIEPGKQLYKKTKSGKNNSMGFNVLFLA